MWVTVLAPSAPCAACQPGCRTRRSTGSWITWSSSAASCGSSWAPTPQVRLSQLPAQPRPPPFISQALQGTSSAALLKIPRACSKSRLENLIWRELSVWIARSLNLFYWEISLGGLAHNSLEFIFQNQVKVGEIVESHGTKQGHRLSILWKPQCIMFCILLGGPIKEWMPISCFGFCALSRACCPCNSQFRVFAHGRNYLYSLPKKQKEASLN